MINEEDIEIIPLVEIQGVKFSSKNFQLEISLRQVMIIKKKKIFENCLIKLNKKEAIIEESNNLEAPPRDVEEDVSNVEEEKSINEEISINHENSVDTMNTNLENSNEENSIVETDEICETQADTETPIEESKNQIDLQEVSIDTIEETEPIVLKKPSDVYYEMWRNAREKAKIARKEALAAYLEAKQIKENFMLDGLDTDTEDENEEEYVLE